MRTLLHGLAAGAAGTAAMTAWQELLPRLRGSGGESGGGEEPASEEERWREAPTPAQAARLVLRAVGVDPPASRIPLLTHATHWAYGIGWGCAYGLIRGRGVGNPVSDGVPFGLGVWLASYAQLVPLGLYEPPWAYPAASLAEDVSYHLVYGVGVAGAYRLVGATAR